MLDIYLQPIPLYFLTTLYEGEFGYIRNASVKLLENKGRFNGYGMMLVDGYGKILDL